MFPLSTRKDHKEVHIDILPLPCGNFYALIQASRPSIFGLDSFTISTFSHKLCYGPFQIIPPIYLLQVAVYLGCTEMNGISQSMGFIQNLPSLVVHIRHTQPTLTPKYLISPWDKVSMDFPSTESFNSINIGSRCCLSFTSTTKKTKS